MARSLRVRCVLAACFALAAGGIASTARKSVADEPPKGHCCSPAYVEDTPPLPTNATGCAWQKTLAGYVHCVKGTFPPGVKACESNNPRYQRLIKGECVASAAGKCITDAATVTFVVYKGWYACKPVDNRVCECFWNKNLPADEKDETGTDCKNTGGGGGAAAAPTGETDHHCAVLMEE